MKQITINTVQGIGDLIWVYRKLSLIYDKINMNVLIIEHDQVQKRSEEFLKTLDKIGEITFKLVGDLEYSRVAKTFYSVDSISNDYCVNAWLENGIHIDAIDRSPVSWDIGLKVKTVPKANDYLLLYVSGCNHNSHYYQMDSTLWAQLVFEVCRYLKVRECKLIGAEYDKDKLLDVKRLINRKIKTSVTTNASIQETMGTILGSKYFISYQSGLSIIAEELGVPTLMIYYPENRKMVSTWIRRENLLRGLIESSFFSEPIATIIDSAKRHIDRIIMGK